MGWRRRRRPRLCLGMMIKRREGKVLFFSPRIRVRGKSEREKTMKFVLNGGGGGLRKGEGVKKEKKCKERI
jgi:hypothetical protein